MKHQAASAKEEERIPSAGHENSELTPQKEAQILKEISGYKIEEMIITLAQVDGQPIEPTKELAKRYAVNKLALTEQDMNARKLLKQLFLEAGMTVEEHPLGLIATYEGQNPNLPAIGMMSHFDSVPTAGMYDGTVGILSAIQVIQVLKKHNFKPKKSIKILAFTGEESARFNIALFGSRGMLHGLSARELQMRDASEISIEQAIINLGLNPNTVKKPRFSKNDFEAMIEFHVAQDNRFPEKLAIIEAIAAPERYKLEIGESKLEKIKHQPTDRFLTITIRGEAGHSGATPMGDAYRTDGLVIASEIIPEVVALNTTLRDQNAQTQIVVGNMQIPGQSMNKIPGKVVIPLCITGENTAEIEKQLRRIIHKKQRVLTKKYKKKNIVELQTTQKQNEVFYDPQSTHARQLSALHVIQEVHKAANELARTNCVGTVSTYTTQDGIITLGIDLRGVDESSRSRMISKIKQATLKKTGIQFTNPLPGSGKPEAMNKKLITLAKLVAHNLNIPYTNTFSPAGHDIQNVSRAEIPSLLLFCPSRNGGIAHTPEEYSTPQDLEWGTKTMAALVLQLAQYKNDI